MVMSPVQIVSYKCLLVFSRFDKEIANGVLCRPSTVTASVIQDHRYALLYRDCWSRRGDEEWERRGGRVEQKERRIFIGKRNHVNLYRCHRLSPKNIITDER